MILDATEYEASVDVFPALSFELETYQEWAKKNNIETALAFGRLYFKKAEHAVLFRLRFAL